MAGSVPDVALSQGRNRKDPPTADGKGDEFLAVQLTNFPRQMRTRSNVQSFIKQEDTREGNIQCPDCRGIICVGDRGCNVITCRNHSPLFVHFCLHCKQLCPDGYSTCACSKRNTPLTRAQAKKERNNMAKENPIEIDLSDSDDDHSVDAGVAVQTQGVQNKIQELGIRMASCTSNTPSEVSLVDLLSNACITVALLPYLRLPDVKRLAVTCKVLLKNLLSSDDKIIEKILSCLAEIEIVLCFLPPPEEEDASVHLLASRIVNSIRKHPSEYRIVQFFDQGGTESEMSKSLCKAFDQEGENSWIWHSIFQFTHTGRTPWTLEHPREIFADGNSNFSLGGPFPEDSYDYIPPTEENTNEPKKKKRRRKLYIHKDWIHPPRNTDCSSPFCKRGYLKDLGPTGYLLFYVHDKPYCCACMNTHKKIRWCQEHELCEDIGKDFQLCEFIASEENAVSDEEVESNDEQKGPAVKGNEFCVSLFSISPSLYGANWHQIYFVGVGPRGTV